MENSKRIIDGLLRLILSIALLIYCVNLSAQDNFYYYKGEKMQLELNREYIFISGVDKNHIANAKIDDIFIDIKNSTETEEDNTSQRLLRPNDLKVKHPTRYRKEIKLEGDANKNYLSQIEALRKANPDLIIAPYFKNESIEKVGLSNYFHVKLKQAEDFEIMREQIEKYDLELIGQNQFMPLWYSVSVTPKTLNALKMANIFYETGLFQYTTPDLLAAMPDNAQTHQTTTVLTPNDPYYSDQWHLKNTGQHGGIPGMDINAEPAWDITLGDHGIVVAVIDEGFQTNHPDLIDNIVNNGYDSHSGTIPANVYGPHGTPCAGIIGAKGNNNEGISGVAPDIGLMPVSFQFGSSSSFAIGNAISWAWMNGADVISNSWWSIESELISDPIDDALTMGRGGLGAIVVGSAGNYGFPVHFPANSHPDVLAVGAMSPCGERKTPNSCDGLGGSSNIGDDLDIMAPGGGLIPATDIQYVAGYNTGDNSEDYTDLDYHYSFGGTSSTCPQVAGVAALVLSLNPNLTGQEVRDIIEQSARKVRTDLYVYENTAGRSNGIWNGEMGYGLLDAHAAVSLAIDEALICPLDMTVICAADIVPGIAEFQTTCATGSNVAITGPIIDGVPDCPGTTYTYTFTGTDDCGLQRTCTQTFIIDDNETSTTEEVTLISENDLFVGMTDEESFASNGTYVFTDTTTPAGAVISRITLTLYYRVEGASCESDIEFRLSDPAGNVIYTRTPFSTCDGSGTHPAGQLYSLTHSPVVQTTTSDISNWVLEFRDTNDQNVNAAEYSVRFGRLRYDAVVTTQDAESCCGTTNEFTSCPEDISLTITPGYCGGIATWTVPTTTGGTLTSTHNPGDEFPVGCTTVTYTIEGTDVTCSFEVCVEECSDGGTPGSPTTETITLISENDLFIGEADTESFASNGRYLFTDLGTAANAVISNATLQLFFRVENASCESDIEIRLNDPAGNVVYTGTLFTTCNGSGTHPAGQLYNVTIPISGGNTTGSTANWVLEFRDINDQNTGAVEYSVRFGRLIYDATVTTSGESTETITLIDDADAFIGFNDMESFGSNTTYTFNDLSTPSNAVLSNITLQLFFRVEGASCENEIEIRVNDPAGNVVFTGPMFTTCNGSGTHPFGDLYQNTISLPGGTAMTTGNPDDWVVEFRDTNDQNTGANEYSVRFGRLIYDATVTTTGIGGGCTEPAIVNCPANITVNASAGECEAAVSVPIPQFGADFIDCTSATIANDYTGTANASATYPAGITTVTWTVTDAGGNTATCTQNITVNSGFIASDAVELISDSDLLIGGADTESFADNGVYLFTDPATPAGAALSNIRLLLFFRVENASCESDIEIRVNDPAGNMVYLGSPFTTCNGSGANPYPGQLYNTTVTIPSASTTGSLDNWVVEFRDTNDQNVGATEYSVRFGRINYDVGGMLDCDPMFINQGGTPSVTSLLVEEAIGHDIKLYPIPTMRRLILEYTTDEDEQIQIEMFNVNGQALRSFEAQVFKGVNTIELDVYGLPDGIYYIKTIDNLGITKVKPFTKLAP